MVHTCGAVLERLAWISPSIRLMRTKVSADRATLNSLRL